MRHSLGFAPDEIVEAICRVGVDKAIAYPFAGLYAAGLSASPFILKGLTYPSEMSAMTSNASSTPSSPISTPDSRAAL